MARKQDSGYTKQEAAALGPAEVCFNRKAQAGPEAQGPRPLFALLSSWGTLRIVRATLAHQGDSPQSYLHSPVEQMGAQG